jgi:hypothetical protein
MRRLLIKLAPTVAVLVLASYCCLPDSVSPAADAGGKNKPPELTAVLLAPRAVPAPARDPFDLNTVRSKTVAASRPAPPETRPGKTAVGTRTAARGHTLSATLLRGERRMARINGKFFTEGEPLKGVSAGALTLARVFPDHVLLRQGEEMVELKFPEKPPTRPSPGAGQPGAGKPAKSTRPAQTPPRTRTR